MWEIIGSLLGGGIINWITQSPEMKAEASDLGLTPWDWYQDQEGWKRQQQVNLENWSRQKELNQMNIKNQWDMWNAANRYNSPAAQMQRYKEAGLNPNLIYGQSNTTSPISIPTAQNVDYKASSIPSSFNQYMEKIAELPFMKQKLEQEKAEAELKRNEAHNIELTNRILANNVLQSDFETLHKNLLMRQDNTLLTRWDSLESAYLSSILEKWKESSEKNKATRAVAALHEANKMLNDLKIKWFGGSPETGQGIYELQRDLLGVKKSLGDIDLDWKNSLNLTGALSPWVKMLLNFIK